MLRPDTLALTALLALLTGIAPLSVDMYLPSLPDIGRQFSASPAEVQLTLSIYLVGFAAGQIVYGPLSDRHGRKPILLAALAIYCVATLACALAPTVTVLIVARGVQALGGSAAVVLTRAIVRDLYSGIRAARELSLMGAIMALAPVIAPLIGGVLQNAFGWRASFSLLVVVGLGATFIVYRLLPETLRTPSPEAISPAATLRVYRELAAHRGFLAHLGIVSFTYAGLFAWISAAAFVLQNIYGLSALQFGFAFAAGSVGFLIGTSLAARLVVRIGLDRTIGIGTAALGTGGLAMAAGLAFGLAWPLALVLPAAIYLAGLGLAMPQAMAGALTPFPQRAGSASSLVGAVQQTAAAIVGAVVGHVLSETAWPLAVGMATMGCLAFALWACSRTARQRDISH